MPKDKQSDEAPARAESRDAVTARMKTPDQWAAERFPPGPRGQPHREMWKHAAADALHGWRIHAHHYPKSPVTLREEDYNAALAAASVPKDGATQVPQRQGKPISVPGYVPHKPAATDFAARKD